jgi:D-alanyl-D-alanine carboxypeptidase/D-alanyl-D-alanine-endopeptidase (penicillin-binding protein 4)
MRLMFTIFLYLMTISLFGQSFSQRKIRRMLKKIPAFEKAHIALIVEPLNTANPKAFYQGANYMTPASNIKLLTFLAAIQSFDSLPMLYFKEKDSIMHFKATGYPLLFHPFYPDHDLASFFKQKYTWRYHPSKSELNDLGHGWSWDDYHYYFAAQTSPFPIYGNTTQIFRESKKTQLIPKLFEQHLVIDTLVQNFSRQRSKNIFYLNPKKLNQKDTLYRPFITSDSLFIQLLEQGIEAIVELVKPSYTDLNWDLLYSKQEAKIYKALLRDSDNGIAEALLNIISQTTFDEMNIQKTIDTLEKQWRSWLPDPIEWVDGSGVSRYNMITPRTLIAVLKKIHQEIGFETIKKYFPKSATSGTLKNYSLQEVYAKTGTLRHNHNLSGYWVGKNKNVYVFSVMVNHFTVPKDQIREGISNLIRQFQKKLK